MAACLGDIPGKLALVRRDLTHIRYPLVFDEEGAARGRPRAFLPVISHILFGFSRHISEQCAARQIYKSPGRRYVQKVFGFVRDILGMRIALSPSQFLSEGYAERKLIFLHQLITASRQHHTDATRKERLENLRARKYARRDTTADCPQEYGNVHTRAEFRKAVRLMPAVDPSPAGIHRDPVRAPTQRQLDSANGSNRHKCTQGPLTPPDQPRALHRSLGLLTWHHSPPCTRTCISTGGCEGNPQGGAASDVQRDPFKNLSEIPTHDEGTDSLSSKPSSTCTHLAGAVYHDLRSVHAKLEALKSEAEVVRRGSLAFESSTEANIRVLEARVCQLERSVRLFRAEQTHMTLRRLRTFNAGNSIHTGAQNATSEERRDRQAYWTSPIASFNPLFVREGPSSAALPSPGATPTCDLRESQRVQTTIYDSMSALRATPQLVSNSTAGPGQLPSPLLVFGESSETDVAESPELLANINGSYSPADVLRALTARVQEARTVLGHVHLTTVG